MTDLSKNDQRVDMARMGLQGRPVFYKKSLSWTWIECLSFRNSFKPITHISD